MRRIEKARTLNFGGWLCSVASSAVIAGLSTSALAQVDHSTQRAIRPIELTSVTAVAATNAIAPKEEVNRYYLRLMTQIFDGSTDFSHTQVAGFARMRKDNQSWTMMDFGDGAVVISDVNGLSVGGFENVSGTELGVLYDYDSKRIAGNSEIANFHNQIVRPHLDKSPALGADADWTASLPAKSLGMPSLSGQNVLINLSRRYFIYNDKPMVLIEYQVPVVSFNSVFGAKVMHWGRGFALSDPGFGNIYANVALHRSAKTENDGSIRPYRFYRAAFASDDTGKPMLDIRKIPQVAALYNDYFGKEALEVMPYVDDGITADQAPIKLASNLDIIAMSIGENGANDNGTLAGAQTGGNRGEEKPKPLPQPFGGIEARDAIEAVGAPAFTVPEPTNPTPGVPVPSPEANQATNQARYGDERPKVEPQPYIPDERPLFDSEGNPIVYRGGGSGGSGGGEGGQGTGSGGGSSSSNSSNAIDGAVEFGINLNAGVSAADKSTTITSTILLSNGINLVQEANAIHSTAKSISDEIEFNRQLMTEATGNYEFAVKQKLQAVRSNPNLSAAEFAALNRKVETASTALQEANRRVNATASGLQRSLQRLESKAAALSALIAKTPLPELTSYLSKFGDSPAGKILGAVSHGLNTATAVTAVSNAANASVTDLSTGNLALTRAYGLNFASLSNLGLDLVAIAGNLYAGNVAGAISDGSALVLGSISDTYIAIKAAEDAHNLSLQASDEYLVNKKKLNQRQAIVEAEKLKEFKEKEYGLYSKADPYKDGYDVISPAYNPDVAKMSETHKQYLIKHNRGEAIRLGLITPDAPDGGYSPEGQAPQSSASTEAKPAPVVPERIKATANQDYNYPIASADANDKRPVKGAKPADANPTVNPAQQIELDRAARQAQAKADLEAYQAKRLAERKAEEALRIATPRGGPFRTSALNISNFNVKPINFSGVNFDEDGDLFVRNADGTTSLKKVGPDDFKAPTFVGPQFNAPKASGLGWTNFADDDYPGSGEVPAFGYESMSGKIATDLSRWKDWLATQDIRQLERLARSAGYPNLASALNDAANLIRQSQDKGYVQWALSPPSCGGYVGCGPSYLERWGMKISTVKLGNILNQSRDVFSTGGLSDIAISREALNYMLRDFGLQDGDIVDVLVQQFGRDLFRGRVNLTNGGEAFDILLRRGVAVLTLTAVNEGSVSPNTAEINIQEVTRGDSRQTYSLRTGESATLRIETNRPAGN